MQEKKIMNNRFSISFKASAEEFEKIEDFRWKHRLTRTEVLQRAVAMYMESFSAQQLNT